VILAGRETKITPSKTKISKKEEIRRKLQQIV